MQQLRAISIYRNPRSYGHRNTFFGSAGFSEYHLLPQLFTTKIGSSSSSICVLHLGVLIDNYTKISIYRYLSMAKTDALQGSLDLLVLKILSQRPRLHGYAIMVAIANTSGEVLRAEEGSLYPALYRMEEAGWIRAEWIKKDTGRRARVYELTAAGKKQLGAEESRWQSVSLAINRVLREA
jgi:PadR family transcriptional regulator PadR